MESLLSYLQPLLLLPLALYLISLIRKNRSDDRKNLPPGSIGWPIIGETIAYGRLGPEKFIKNRMLKHSSEVFQTSLWGEKLAVFCGPQGNKFLFTNEGKFITPWMPKSMKKALMIPDFDNYIYAGSPAVHILTTESLSPEALKKYIPVVDELAGEHLSREWKCGAVVKIFPLSKKYTFELACRLLLGVVDPDRIKRLFEPFTELTTGMFTVPVDLPGTAYNRAIKAGKMVGEELVKIIERRREDLMQNPWSDEREDCLSKTVMFRDDDGKLLSDESIASDFIGGLVASFDTTSSAITCIINYLAQLPHIYNEVFKEQMAIAKLKGPNEPLTWEDVQKMKYSWNVARESPRLMPPAQGTFREATCEFTYAGFTIPKGWKTFWTVNSTHKNPNYFPEPEKFDPSRFEGSGPAPYTFVPFGGGPRICPGRDYAKFEILTFMYNVVTRYKLEKTMPEEKIVFYASPTPVHGLPLRLLPHQD